MPTPASCRRISIASSSAVEALPWVMHARIQRRWPNSLHVTVIEQTAAARWGDSGLLNTRGELFVKAAAHVPAELPRLSGPEGSESQVAQRYMSVQGRMLEAGMRIAALRLDERGAWEMDLDSGVTVRLGRRDVDERIAPVHPNRLASDRAPLERYHLCGHALLERLRHRLARPGGAGDDARQTPRRRRCLKEHFIDMAKRSDRNLLVGLDIGTSKVVAIVGEIKTDGALEIIGIGSHPSRGLKKGVVVNIESTVQSIQRAVEEAELMAGCEIHSVYAGIAGSHVRSINSHGIVAIKDKEVVQGDVERVIDAAKAVAIPADQKILHVLPQEYIIDSQEGIRDPIGMSGVRLEAKVHIVTGADSAAQNIVKCVQRCGLAVDDIVLEQLASSYAVLTEDEKDLGVCVVDIGGGTTDIAVFGGGAIRHTAVIPIAGDQVTNDIAVSMRTPTQYAEDIKIKYACALSQLANPDETIEVPSVGDRPPRRLARQTLAEIVEPRYEELFGLVRDELRRAGLEESVATGIVLTGGSAKMEGAVELAEEVFHMPVRLGVPQYVSGLVDVVSNPIHATGVGLLLYAKSNLDVQRTEGAAARGRHEVDF